ncbi:Rab-GAP TBC domain-containing protein [Entamoeba marina]
MFDIRQHLNSYYCQHVPSSTKQKQQPVHILTFPVIHSMFLSQTESFEDAIKPPPPSLTYECVLNQIEKLSTSYEIEREKVIWGNSGLTQQKKHRKRYEELCKQSTTDLEYLNTANQLSSYANDANLIPPDPDSNLNVKIEHIRVSWDIKKDVRRTKLEERYQTCENRRLLHRILYLYAVNHMDIGYSQGMNELIAILFNVTIIDYTRINGILQEKNDSNSTFLQTLFDLSYLEHDVYILFEKLMDVVCEWYENDSKNTPTIISKCNTIRTILEVKDSHTADNFKRLDIEPQLFLLRWVRILFCQMFTNSELYYIWDIIFAHSLSLSLVDHICVVLMALPRSKICNGDSLDAFNIFFNYPSSHPISFIMNTAILSRMHPMEPLFQLLEPRVRIEKRRPKTPTVCFSKELSFDDSVSLDVESIHTRLVLIEDALGKAVDSLDKEKLAIQKICDEITRLKKDVKASQTVPTRKDH